MARLRYDNALGSLGASLTSGGTVITFAAAPSFATLTGSDYIPLVLEPGAGSSNPNFEIVHLTAYTAGATTGTILRGQEGTTGVAHANTVAWLCGPVTQDFVPSENVNVVSASGSGTVAIPDVSADTVSDVTLTGTPTFTFPSAVAGKSFTVILRQDGTGGRTVTWPTVTWLGGGSAPALSTGANAVDVATFICTDGTHWLGAFMPGYAGSDEWVAEITPYSTAPVSVVGTWNAGTFNSTTFPNSGFGRGGFAGSTGAQNDSMAYKLPLSAGTYTIQLAVRESTNTGIVTVQIDGVSVGTLDTYNASAGTPALLALTGVTVAQSGVHEIKLLMATKNGSSSAYHLCLFNLGITRTA